MPAPLFAVSQSAYFSASSISAMTNLNRQISIASRFCLVLLLCLFLSAPVHGQEAQRQRDSDDQHYPLGENSHQHQEWQEPQDRQEQQKQQEPPEQQEPHMQQDRQEQKSPVDPQIWQDPQEQTVSSPQQEQNVSAPQQESNEQPIYKYVGNLFSLKFHRPSCKFARVMWRQHVIRFQYRKQAIDAGQKPCRYCLPPNWKSVEAKILGTESMLATPAKRTTERPQFEGIEIDEQARETGDLLHPLPVNTEIDESKGMKAQELPSLTEANRSGAGADPIDSEATKK